MPKIQLLFVDGHGEACGYTEPFDENVGLIIPQNAYVLRIRFIGPKTPEFNLTDSPIIEFPQPTVRESISVVNPPGTSWDEFTDRPDS